MKTFLYYHYLLLVFPIIAFHFVLFLTIFLRFLSVSYCFVLFLSFVSLSVLSLFSKASTNIDGFQSAPTIFFSRSHFSLRHLALARGTRRQHRFGSPSFAPLREELAATRPGASGLISDGWSRPRGSFPPHFFSPENSGMGKEGRKEADDAKFGRAKVFKWGFCAWKNPSRVSITWVWNFDLICHYCWETGTPPMCETKIRLL